MVDNRRKYDGIEETDVSNEPYPFNQTDMCPICEGRRTFQHKCRVRE